MKVTIQNLGTDPFSTDIENSQGEMIRQLVPPLSTLAVANIDPYYLNQDKELRKLVAPDGGQIVYTLTALGYTCQRVGGFLIVGFEREPDDLVALVLPPSGGSGTDSHTVMVTAADTTPDYLRVKLAAGPGISLAVLNPGANEQVEIMATGALPAPTNIGQMLYAATVAAFTREIPVVTVSGFIATTINGFIAVRGP